MRLKVSGSHFLCSSVFYYIATNIAFLRSRKAETLGTMGALPCPYDFVSKRRGWPQHHLMASKLHSVKPWTSNPHPPEYEMQASSSNPGLLGYIALAYWALYLQVLLFCHETSVVRADPTEGAAIKLCTHRDEGVFISSELTSRFSAC